MLPRAQAVGAVCDRPALRRRRSGGRGLRIGLRVQQKRVRNQISHGERFDMSLMQSGLKNSFDPQQRVLATGPTDGHHRKGTRKAKAEDGA